MNRRPPAVLERLVSWLVPSGSREHVLGDFSEMYRSPAQYGIQALRTVPILVIHLLRRRWDGVLVAIEACALLMAFHRAWRFANLPLLRGISDSLSLAIPAVAVLIGLTILDVYVDREKQPLKHLLSTAPVGLAAALLAGFFIEVPRIVIVEGVLIGAAILALVHSCLLIAGRLPVGMVVRHELGWWQNTAPVIAGLLVAFPFMRIIRHASGTAPRVWASLIIVVAWCAIYQHHKKPDLQRAGKWLWVMFAVMAFGVSTSPTPNLAGVEIRLMASASITFVFLLAGRAMQLSEARLRVALKSE
jgi:hypothetical protein